MGRTVLCSIYDKIKPGNADQSMSAVEENEAKHISKCVFDKG